MNWFSIFSPEDLLYVQFFLLVFIWLLLAAIYGLLGVIKRQQEWIDKYTKTVKTRATLATAIAPEARTADARKDIETLTTWRKLETVEEEIERRR